MSNNWQEYHQFIRKQEAIARAADKIARAADKIARAADKNALTADKNARAADKNARAADKVADIQKKEQITKNKTPKVKVNLSEPLPNPKTAQKTKKGTNKKPTIKQDLPALLTGMILCKKCEKPFEQVGNRRAKYCCKECGRREAKEIIKKCAKCDRPFPNSQAKYCSAECRIRKEVNSCLQCKKPTVSKKNKFCSVPCYRKYEEILKPKGLENCLRCGKKLKKGQMKFCSVNCSALHALAVNSQNPEVRKKGTATRIMRSRRFFTCKQCKHQFRVKNYKKGQKYCSRDCLNKFKQKIPK